MQLYVSDYLGDTRHLTTEQHGAYLLLLMTMWRSEGVLPSDDVKLARIAGLTVSRWKKIADDVLAFFTVCEGGITQGRLAAELTIADEKSEKRSQAGKAGGRAKSLKDKKAGVASAMRSPCHSPEPEPLVEANASPNISRIEAKTDPTRAQIASGFLAFWSAYPRHVGKDAAAKAFAKAMARIKDADPLSVILSGIERALSGWDDPQFIPHPATWLNQGRWEDDAPAPRTGLTRNDRPNRPDKTAERADNYAAAWAGADRASEILADRGKF